VTFFSFSLLHVTFVGEGLGKQEEKEEKEEEEEEEKEEEEECTGCGPASGAAMWFHA